MRRQAQRKIHLNKMAPVEIPPADWRSAALEALPELESKMEEIDTPMRLWIEIHWIFEQAYRDHPRNEDLIRRIYMFVGWCEDQEQPSGINASEHFITCIAVAFFEHIPQMAESRLDMPRWFSKARVQSMREIFGHFLSDAEFEQLLNLFPGSTKQEKRTFGHRKRR